MSLAIPSPKISLENIKHYIVKTQLTYSERLSKEINSNIFLKLENLQKTGSFKARGALNKILNINNSKDVVAASSGNHGAAVSYALSKKNMHGTIYVPKNVKKSDAESSAEIFDIKGNVLLPGIVDMKAFVGEPGYEYKENFRTLSNAALSGGVTSVVTMPNTNPVIDNVSIVDFLKRRGRDKSKINIYPSASLTMNTEGTNMTEFGLLQSKGIIAFTDGTKTIQNTRYPTP